MIWSLADFECSPMTFILQIEILLIEWENFRYPGVCEPNESIELNGFWKEF